MVCIPLTPAHRRARLKWCLEHHAWTHDQWANVLFSDESRFSLSTDSRRVFIWREPGTRYHPSNIREIDSFRGGSLLVWAGISSSRRTPLHIFSGGTLTAQRYRDEILEPYLRPYRDQIGHNLILMDDNARPHRARLVNEYLQSENIRRMDWPARSPDLNPIEHVWDALGKRIGARHPSPRTLVELRTALLEEWGLLPLDLLQSLVNSMRARCETLIAVGDPEVRPFIQAICHRKRRQFKQTDAFTRGMVIGLKRAGWSIRQIAADTHLGASTVHRLWRRWLEQGNVAIYRNVGATRVTSARVDRRILRQAVAAPQATCTAILQHVQDTLDHSISTRTISRRLVANGLHSCRPLRRLPLTPPNRRQRLEWCRARSTWMTEWHRVVFSDESRFCLSSDSRRVRVWRRRGERSNPAAIVERPTVRQRGIMVWGAIAYDSRSPLLRIQGTMTAQRYVDDVLRPVTLPYLQGVPNALYQQDNARPHTARISQQALQDVQMLPWPPYSPDLSPIEHVWDIIGRRLHALPQPRSEDELWQMVEREWRAIPQDAISILIDSLPRRVAACIAVRVELKARVGKWDPEVKALLMFEALSPEVRFSLEEMGIRNDSSFKSIASKLNILYPKKARGIRECLKLIEGLKQRVGESPMVFKERFLAIRDKVEYSFDDSLVFEIFLENVLDKYREAIVRSEAKSIEKAVSVMATEDSVEHRCSFMKGVCSVEGVEEINSIKSEMKMLSASVNRMKHENEQCIADLRGEIEKLTKLLGEIRLSPSECRLGHIASDCCSRQSSMFANRNTLDNAEIVNIRSYGGDPYGNLPIVKVNINGNMWHLLYDTGSQVSIIDSEKCKVLKENWDDALKTLRIVSVTGQEQTLTRVKTCRVGNENGIELGEIRFWLMSLGDKAYDGILGINDIRRFNIPLPAIRERCNMISLKPEDRDYVDLSYVASVHRPMVSSSFEEKSVKRIENEAVKLPPTEFNRNCECSAGSVNSFRKPTWAERLRVMRKAKETVRQFMSGNSAKKLMNPRPPYSRSFDRGDLVMLAVPKTEGYSNVYGPFRVEARVSDVNFR
ncbi:hypothetical protein LAZ67_17000439, partial [Cordylochernes scorpioides]